MVLIVAGHKINNFECSIVVNIRYGNNNLSKYDQEIPLSQTAFKPWHREEEPHNNHETPGRQTKQSNPSR